MKTPTSLKELPKHLLGQRMLYFAMILHTVDEDTYIDQGASQTLAWATQALFRHVFAHFRQGHLQRSRGTTDTSMGNMYYSTKCLLICLQLRHASALHGSGIKQT